MRCRWLATNRRGICASDCLKAVTHSGWAGGAASWSGDFTPPARVSLENSRGRGAVNLRLATKWVLM